MRAIQIIGMSVKDFWPTRQYLVHIISNRLPEIGQDRKESWIKTYTRHPTPAASSITHFPTTSLALQGATMNEIMRTL